MARRWITYKGRKILIEDNGTKYDAMKRVDAQIAQEEADRREREIAEAEKRQAELNAREERKKTPKYSDMSIVLGKDGKYYEVWEGYFDKNSGEVLYEALAVDRNGKYDMDNPNWKYGYGSTEISQKDIQKLIKKGKG